MPENMYKPVARRQDIVTQELDKEVLIYDLKANKAFSLNPTSALIWQFSDGSKTVSDIAKNLSGRLDSTVSEQFVWFGLEQLKKDDLLEDSFVTKTPFNGLSRREVVRRVGLASLVALPLVISLAAPTAAHAQSTGCFGDNNAGQSANGCVCNSASDCQSNCCGSNGATAICVDLALDPEGSACRAGCECDSNCCVGGVCQNGELPGGAPCTTACQCASNSCPAVTAPAVRVCA